MSKFRRLTQYLGLGDDAEYDDDYEQQWENEGYDEPAVVTRPTPSNIHPPTTGTVRAVPVPPGRSGPPGVARQQPGVTRQQPGATRQQTRREPAGERDRHDRGDDRSPTERSRPNRSDGPVTSGTSAVRPMAQSQPAKVTTINVESFNDAQLIGDRMKSGQPVIINVAGVDRDLLRRIIDFSSGVVYVLNAKMERVTEKVYLLTPANAEVSVEDRRRLRERPSQE